MSWTEVAKGSATMVTYATVEDAEGAPSFSRCTGASAGAIRFVAKCQGALLFASPASLAGAGGLAPEGGLFPH